MSPNQYRSSHFLRCTLLLSFCWFHCSSQQWTDIWFEDGTTTTDQEWTDKGYVYWDYDSNYDGQNTCTTGKCMMLWAELGTDSSVSRVTNVTPYDKVRLKYDLVTYLLESNDGCNIFYAYDSSSKQLATSITPPDSTAHHYTDQYLTFPSSTNKNQMWLWLETSNTNSDQTDLCFWDNIYLQGAVLTPDPTQQPSSSPKDSDDPSASPTRSPSRSPTDTDDPSSSPTRSPSHNPSGSPTSKPTHSPNNQPIATATPSGSPTRSPSHNPSGSQTSKPSQSPNKPSIAPSPSPILASTTEDTSTHSNGNANVNDGFLSRDRLPFVIGAAGICCLCFCVCFAGLCKVLKSKQKDEKQLEQAGASMTMSPPPVPMQVFGEKARVESFFTDELGLARYYPMFLNDGYDSMRSIFTIQSKEELEAIGVTIPEHQSFILAQVKRLAEEEEKGDPYGRKETNATTNTENTQKAEVDDYEEHEMDDRMKKDRKMLKAWFDFNVGLGKYKYHTLFIKNGFESMKAIQAIRSKDEIKEIGVQVLGHRALIFSEIQRLNTMMANDQMYRKYNYNVQQRMVPGVHHEPYGVMAVHEGNQHQNNNHNNGEDLNLDLPSSFDHRENQTSGAPQNARY